MGEVQKAIIIDGVHTNLVNTDTGLNENHKEVSFWYDGSPMDDSKVDGKIYRKKDGIFLRKVMDKDGELFLEKDSIADLRSIDLSDILLLKSGSYRGIRLSGYYVKGDTPAPIEYYITDSVLSDNGFNIIEASGVKFQSYFKDNIIHASYAGVVADGVTNNNVAFGRVIDYINTYKNGVLYTPAGRILVSNNAENTLFFIKDIKNFVIHAEQTIFFVNDLDDFLNVNLVYTNVGGTAIITATSATNHGFVVDNEVCIKGTSDVLFSGYYRVTRVISPTQFEYVVPYAPTASASIGKVRIRSISKRFISFVNCTNVNVNTINFEGTVQPQNIQPRMGWTAIRLSGGINIQGKINTKGVVYGLLSGEDTVDNGNCSNINFVISGEDIGYPFYLGKTAKNSYVEVHAERVHRGGYITGVENLTALLYVKNYDVTGCLIGFHRVTDPNTSITSVYGSKNINVTVIDTGSNVKPTLGNPASSTRWMVGLSGYDVDDFAEMNNISVTLQAQGAKYTNGCIAQTYNAKHTLKNITVSGLIDNSVLLPEECGVEYSFGAEREEVAGQYSGIAIQDLTVLQPDGLSSLPRITCKKLIDNPKFLNYKTNSSVYLVLPNKVKIDHSVTSIFDRNLESGLLQSRSAKLVNSAIQLTDLTTTIGDGDFSINLVCEVPAGGNCSLYNISASLTTEVPNSVRAWVESNSLFIKLISSTLGDFAMFEIRNFQTANAGKMCSIVITRELSSVTVFINGTATKAIKTGNTDPSIISLNGTKILFGAMTTTTSYYVGRLSTLNVYNYNISQDIVKILYEQFTTDNVVTPLAIISPSINNGGFEILGSPVFANWNNRVMGTSSVSASTDSYQGTYAAKIQCDAAQSYVDINQSVLVQGRKYKLSLYAKGSQNNTSISVEGVIGADTTMILNTAYKKFSFPLLYAISPSFSIKRLVLKESSFALIDNVTLIEIGLLSKNESGVIAPATVSVKGTVAAAAAQSNISINDLFETTASDLPGIVTYINTNIVPLVNAIKSSQNTELTNQRTAGQQSLI